MSEPSDGSAAELRCDFCQSSIPEAPVVLEREEADYRFCTEACRDAMGDADRVFTSFRGHRQFDPGVAALGSNLPQGLLRNSFVLVSSQPGTRDAAMLAELAWRTLQRGEPAVVVSFNQPPVAVVERFLGLGWNVLPYLESGRLHLIDCFTYRVGDRDRMLSRMNEWNSHLWDVAAPETTAVRDPTNIGELENRIDDCLEAKDMADEGVVVIDTLTEFGALVQPVRAYDFVKDLRAEVCKGRFVPVFAGATYAGDAEQFPHDLEYLFDGIVDLELNPEIVEGALIKRARIRKMAGVLSYAQWTAYEFTSGEGLVMFDPEAEVERSEAEREAAAEADDTASE
ncbi:MAG: ATPase domain-containing protein [Halobacteriales archaeon]|nr:ATPase domain-containing protein [Halobacteriales archaeon]